MESGQRRHRQYNLLILGLGVCTFGKFEQPLTIPISKAYGLNLHHNPSYLAEDSGHQKLMMFVTTCYLSSLSDGHLLIGACYFSSMNFSLNLADHSHHRVSQIQTLSVLAASWRLSSATIIKTYHTSSLSNCNPTELCSYIPAFCLLKAQSSIDAQLL